MSTEMKEFELPSGAKLRVALAPFADGRDLYQAVMREAKSLHINMSEEIDVNLLKDMFCTLLASKEIEACVFKCMQKSLYNDSKITEDVFEPEEARQDYIECLFKVTWENVHPFGKALFAEYGTIFQGVIEGLMSK